MIMQKNDRDCLVCCLAEVFGIPYESIPKFYEAFPVELQDTTDAHGDDFAKRYNTWLETMGYTHIYIEAKFNKEKDLVEYYGMPRKDFVGIASMKKAHRPYSHAVVIKNKDGIVEVIDPKKNSDYELEDLTEIEIFVPRIFNGKTETKTIKRYNFEWQHVNGITPIESSQGEYVKFNDFVHSDTNACFESSCRFYGNNRGCTLDVCCEELTEA